MPERLNPAWAVSDAEFRELVASLSIARALERIQATPSETLLISALIPGIVSTVRARRPEPGLKVAVMTPDECRRLIDGLDALYREDGTDSGTLRSQLVNAAYAALKR